MAGVAALKIKVMPEQDSDLENLKTEVKETLEKAGAIKTEIQEEDIAFGLKALIVTIAWPEDKETEEAETALDIKGVSSVQIIDYRRAFG